MAYALAKYGGRMMSWLTPHRRAILESNLAPLIEDPRQRRRIAAEIFGHALRSYYEMLYFMTHPQADVREAIQFDQPEWSQFEQVYNRGKGVILVITHQSSFDLAGQVATARGFPLMALVLPDASGGFAFLNTIRQSQRIQALPVGPRAVREALRMLRQGGIVIVAGDRPVREQGVVVEFFGRPTLLPDGHVRLALRVGAEIVLGFCRLKKGEYWMRLHPLELARTGDEEADVLENVQRIACGMEPAIRAHPEQWHLFRRLWD
jgi:KDO2-lipid IV(A) lauroyltransferase